MNDLLDSLVEVRIAEEEDFLKIKETLTRIGVASRKERKLYQSCHIFHKQGKYYIVHFKELFLLDGKDSSLSEGDVARRNRIIHLLDEWELIEIVDYNKIDERVLDKLGYEKITAVFHDNNYDNWKTNTYVFINQDGEIEEDMELFKFRQYIFRNPEFMAKLHELLKKQF